jgi:hypothetical protein
VIEERPDLAQASKEGSVTPRARRSVPHGRVPGRRGADRDLALRVGDGTPAPVLAVDWYLQAPRAVLCSLSTGRRSLGIRRRNT